MALIKVTGIVMRYVNYKDYDRILTLFTLQQGKISVLARGTRRPKSTLLNASEQFCMAEYVLNKTNDRYTISSCTILDPFYNIRSDIESFYAASYFSAVCQTLIQEEQPDEQLYSVFAKFLAYLSHSDSSKLENLIIALCTLLEISGFKPRMENCAKCGDTFLDDEEICFNFETGAFVCEACSIQKDIRVSRSCYKALIYIFNHKGNAFSKIMMEDWLIKEIIIFLTKYIDLKLEKSFKQTSLLLSIIN